MWHVLSILLLGPILTSPQSPSLHPTEQSLLYTFRRHSQYLACAPLPIQSHSDLVSVGVLGQLAPHETVQLPAETVQAAPLPLQMPAEAESSVAGVQLQVPQGDGTGQLAAETVQAVVPSLQTPSDAPSAVEGVHLQSQTGQLAGETEQTVVPSLQTPADAESKTDGVQPQVPQTEQPPPGTVQAAPPLLQVPAVASSKIEGVQLQVPQTGTTGQLFAATVQDRDDPVQEAPPHPAATAWLLDCVPALDASVVDGVQLQAPQDPHWQSRGCVPLASLCSVSSQLPVLQPALQSLVLIWVKTASQACVEGSGDHADQGAVPQTIRFTQYCVPVAPRLVEQSPVLHPALQVLVWVKGRPEQIVEVAGDHDAPQRMQDFAPLALRLVAQSPSLQPALQVLVCVKDWSVQTVEVAGDHGAVPQATWATGLSAEHTPELDPPSLPSQRHR